MNGRPEHLRPSDSLAFAVKDLPRITGLGKSHLYQLINTGDLRGRKVGRRIVVLREDIERFLRALPETDGSEK